MNTSHRVLFALAALATIGIAAPAAATYDDYPPDTEAPEETWPDTTSSTSTTLAGLPPSTTAPATTPTAPSSTSTSLALIPVQPTWTPPTCEADGTLELGPGWTWNGFMHTGFVALARPGYVIPVPVTTPPLTRLTGPQCAPLPPESPAPSTSVAVGQPPVPTTVALPDDCLPIGSTRWTLQPCDPSTGTLIPTTTVAPTTTAVVSLPVTGAGSTVAWAALGVLLLGAFALLASRRRP